MIQTRHGREFHAGDEVIIASDGKRGTLFQLIYIGCLPPIVDEHVWIAINSADEKVYVSRAEVQRWNQVA